MKLMMCRAISRNLVILMFSIFMGIFTFFAPSARAECYSYDDLGRLVSVVYDDANVAKRTYTLDEHGNREVVEDVKSGGGVCAQPTGNTSTGQSAAVGSDTYDTETSSSEPPASNTPPVADDEVVALLVNAFMLVNPLEGDTDADGDVLSLASITSASGLLSAVQVDNSVFINAGGFAGTANISYVVSDGNGGTDIGNIFVTINAGGGTVDPCIANPFLPECFGGGDGGIIP